MKAVADWVEPFRKMWKHGSINWWCISHLKQKDMKPQTIFNKDIKNKRMYITREFAAPIANVWQAWTDSKLLDQWWAPRPFRAETKRMDFREGGQWLYAMVTQIIQGCMPRWTISKLWSKITLFVSMVLPMKTEMIPTSCPAWIGHVGLLHHPTELVLRLMWYSKQKLIWSKLPSSASKKVSLRTAIWTNYLLPIKSSHKSPPHDSRRRACTPLALFYFNLCNLFSSFINRKKTQTRMELGINYIAILVAGVANFYWLYGTRCFSERHGKGHSMDV